jgi:hypothetical protein
MERAFKILVKEVGGTRNDGIKTLWKREDESVE